MPIRANEIITEFKANTRELDAAFDKAERKASSFANNLSRSGFRNLESGFKGIANSSGVANIALGNLAATFAVRLVDSAAAAGRTLFDFNNRLEQTHIGFTTLLGSSQKATIHLKALQEFAKSTPFEFEDLVQASRRFNNMGIEAGRVIPILKAVGDAVSAAGGGKDEIDRVSLAISQMAAKGKVSAEEINQLAEAGVGGWRILEQQLGKTKGEIIKLAEEGKISSDLFIKAFERFSQVNFAGAMQKQSQTFNGAMSTIKDTLLLTGSQAIKPFTDRIRDLTVEMANLISTARDVPGVLGSFKQMWENAKDRDAVAAWKDFQKKKAEGFTAWGNEPQLTERQKQLLNDENNKPWLDTIAGISQRGKRQQILKPDQELIGMIGKGSGSGIKKRTANDYGEDFLESLRQQTAMLGATSEVQRATATMLGREYKGLDDNIRHLILTQAALLDQEKKKLNLQERLEKFRDDQLAEINELRGLNLTASSSVDQLIESFRKEGFALDESTEAILRNNAATKEALMIRRERSAIMDISGESFWDFGNGSFYSQSIKDMERQRLAGINMSGGGLTRPRTVLGTSEINQAQQQWSQMASHFTNLFDNAFTDLRERGWKGMLEGMAQDWLQNLQRMAAQAIATNLAGAILGGNSNGQQQNGQQQGGGGGFWGALANIGINVLGSAFGGWMGGKLGGTFNLGGGSSFTPGGTGLVRPRVVGARAEGGPILPGGSYLVGEQGPELVTPLSAGLVIPNHQLQGNNTTNNYSIHLHVSTPNGTLDKRSQQQVTSAMLEALQHAGRRK
jgi:tape measure domain-containing protein